MPLRVTCDCGKRLQVKDNLAGKRIRCPECQELLTVPAAEEPEEEELDEEPAPKKKAPAKVTARAPAKPARRPEPEDDEEEEDERPRGKSKGKKGKKATQSSSNLVLLLGIGGAILVLAGGAVAVLLIMNKPGDPKKPAPQAANTDGKPDDRGKGTRDSGKTDGKGNPDGKRPVNGGPEVAIELFDPKTRYDEQKFQGRDVPVAEVKVKYRFTKGTPQPGKWYLFLVEMGSAAGFIAMLPGEKLEAEGEVTKAIVIPKMDRISPTFKFFVQQGNGKTGPFRTISQEVECPFQIGGGWQGPKTSPSGGTRTDAPVVSAAALAKEFLADKQAFAKKYNDKTVDITGTVYGFDFGEAPSLGLMGVEDANQNRTLVDCHFSAQQEKQVANLTAGQTVKVRGKFTNIGALEFDGCQLLETGPDPALTVSVAKLLQEFAADAAAVDKKYHRKQLLVEGVVIAVQPVEGSGYRFKLAGASGQGKAAWVEVEVSNNFSERQKKRYAAVAVGDTVRVRGEASVQPTNHRIFVTAPVLLKK